jgi:two-component system, LytTR family, response regulator
LASTVLIKCDRKIFFVKQHQINFVEAAGNYVQLSVAAGSLLARISLNRLESVLNAEQFVRIHRSAIVNLDRIRHLEPQAGGDYLVTLDGGKQLTASRRHVCRLLKMLRQPKPEELSAEPDAKPSGSATLELLAAREPE